MIIDRIYDRDFATVQGSIIFFAHASDGGQSHRGHCLRLHRPEDSILSMATTTPDAVPLSMRELTADVGILRRILRGRKWYGTEWYITVLGGTILVVIIVATLLAPVIAPHDPNEFIGAAFTPPGGGLQTLVARPGESPTAPGADLAGQTIGVQRNKNGTNLAKEMELEFVQYQNQEDLLAGLAAGEVDLDLSRPGSGGRACNAAGSELEVVQRGDGPKVSARN